MPGSSGQAASYPSNAPVWLLLQLFCLIARLLHFPRFAIVCAEGILLCDVDQAGWGLQYSNQAITTLTGLTQQRTEGAAFWDLFTLVPSRGAGSDEEVQQAVAKGQPFTLTCRLQAAYSVTAGWALASGRLSGSSEAGAGAGSTRGSLDCSSSIRGPGAFVVTLTPASSPDFRPDEMPIGLPAFASTSNCGAAGACERYWLQLCSQ